MPEQRVLHYQILEKLGEGGMGVAYKAFDTRLRRVVALKMLSEELAANPESRSRLLSEARAAAMLTHPNVCAIYDVEELDDSFFIVMEFIDGLTLARLLEAGPMGAERLHEIALQIADALRQAHKLNLIHRDLKPSNVMLTEEGRVKLLDFGLASLLGSENLEEAAEASTIDISNSISGHLAGTIGYMSPEQIRGDPMDARSDLFSLGVILYELATGRNPFRKENTLQTLASILTQEPPPIRSCVPRFPPPLEQVVMTCLQKNPRDRYGNVDELIVGLRGGPGKKKPRSAALPVRPGSEQTSIAVIPFVNVDGRQQEDFLADGLTTELITRLSKQRRLLVISRASAMRYKNSKRDIAEIGRQLGVHNIVEGRIRRQNDHCRVTVELVGLPSGFVLWADSFDFSLENLLEVETQMAGEIVGTLCANLSREISGPPDITDVDLAAYEAYLQGKQFYYKFSDRDNLFALRAFRKSLRIDPSFARAYADLAKACLARVERGWEKDQSKWVKRAVGACRKALKLNREISEAYSALALISFWQEKNLRAERLVKRALSLNPNDDVAHNLLGRVYFQRGEFGKAARQFKRALRINPFYVWCYNDLAWVYWIMGCYSRTRRLLERVLQINPLDEGAHMGFATHHYLNGQIDAALSEIRESVEINPDYPFLQPILGVTLAAKGLRAEAVSSCQDLLDRNPSNFLALATLAMIHALSGDQIPAQRHLKAALAVRPFYAPLNLTVAVHCAHLKLEDWTRLWLKKAFDEGISTRLFLNRNPFFKGLAPSFGG